VKVFKQVNHQSFC